MARKLATLGAALLLALATVTVVRAARRPPERDPFETDYLIGSLTTMIRLHSTLEGDLPRRICGPLGLPWGEFWSRRLPGGGEMTHPEGGVEPNLEDLLRPKRD